MCQSTTLGACAAALLLAASPARADDNTPPTIVHRAPAGATAARAIEITATIRDPSGVAFPKLYYRRARGRSYSQVTMLGAGAHRYRATVPAFAVESPALEYYLEAFDAQGNGPASSGTPEAPHRIAVSSPGAAPVNSAAHWYSRWWIWAAAGAVLGGTVTAIAVATGGGDGDGGTRLRVSAAPMPAPTIPGLAP